MNNEGVHKEEVNALLKRLRQEERDSDFFAQLYAAERKQHRQTRNELMQLQLIAEELRKQNRALRKRNVKRKLDFEEAK